MQTEYKSILIGELQVINSGFEELGGNLSALKIWKIALIFTYLFACLFSLVLIGLKIPQLNSNFQMSINSTQDLQKTVYPHKSPVLFHSSFTLTS